MTMNNNIRKNSLILFLAVLLGFAPVPSLAAQPASDPAADDTSQAAHEPDDEYELRPELGRIDQAGNKVGEKIEQLGAKASDRLGGWINSRLYFDISWLKLLFCLLLVFLVVVVERLVRFLIQRKIESIPSVEGRISWARLTLRAVVRPLSLLAGILVIQNLTGVEVGPLLASLGIGGLAVALAAKDSIANFFGTLTILFDKPFQVGERIVIENYEGIDFAFPTPTLQLANDAKWRLKVELLEKGNGDV